MSDKMKVSEAAVSTAQAGTAALSRGLEQAAGAAREGASQANANFEKSQVKFKEGVEKAMKTAEELVKFSQGNIEAFVKSGQIWSEGVQDLTKQAAASAQASYEENVSALKALSGARSVKDAIELQANHARSSVERAVANAGRFADASVKLAEQALAPLTARVTLAVEKFAKAA